STGCSRVPLREIAISGSERIRPGSYKSYSSYRFEGFASRVRSERRKAPVGRCEAGESPARLYSIVNGFGGYPSERFDSQWNRDSPARRLSVVSGGKRTIEAKREGYDGCKGFPAMELEGIGKFQTICDG